MAYHPLLLSFMLIISMSSVTHCHNLPSSSSSSSTITKAINGLVPSNRVEVHGVLLCVTPPPSPPIFPPVLPQLNGVNVIFSCDGGNTTIADAMTDENGVFVITAKAVDTLLVILSDPSQSGKCGVIARLPIAGCLVFPPTGLIRAPIGPLHSFKDTLPDGHPNVVHRYKTGRFSYYRQPKY